MALGDLYRLAFEYQDGYGSRLVNVLNYRQELINLVNSGAQDLAESFETAYETLWVGITVVGVEALRLVVRNRTNPTEGFEMPLTQAGNIAGEAMPPADTIVAQLKTGLIGRSFRGEVNIGGVPQDANSNGQVSAAYQGFVGNYIAAITSIGPVLQPGMFTLGVYSQLLAQFNPVTSVLISQDFGHLRSRKPGVGS